MKKIFVALSLAAFAFVGCDDSSSASAGQNDEPGVESSSSVEQGSSSGKKAKSSSSVTQSDAKQSSSGEKTGMSSSSSKDIGTSSSSESEKVSSSSVKSESSSSVENSQSSSSDKTSVSSSSESVEPFSSSAGKVNCPALLEGETGWSWDVPKECRFNPDIDYGTMTDERDGKVYKTVTIGEQVWMAENLNYADSVKTPSLKGRNRCYNNVAANCDVAGRLYTWAAAMDSVKTGCGYCSTCEIASANSTGSSTGSVTLVQGVCPTGWHLPSQAEWFTLFKAVGGKSTAGKVLKSQSGWSWYVDVNATDAFGFSALPTGHRGGKGFPTGHRDVNDYFYDVGNSAFFWSSTEYYSSDYAYCSTEYYSSDYAYCSTEYSSSGYAYFMYLEYNFDDAWLADGRKDGDGGGMMSVRCLKD